MPKCDFFGCTNVQLETKEPQAGMKFCQKHNDELATIIKSEPFSPAKLLKFWIDAKGGATRAAESM